MATWVAETCWWPLCNKITAIKPSAFVSLWTYSKLYLLVTIKTRAWEALLSHYHLPSCLLWHTVWYATQYTVVLQRMVTYYGDMIKHGQGQHRAQLSLLGWSKRNWPWVMLMLSLLLSDGSGIGGNGWTGKRTDGRTDGRTVGRREMTNWSDQHYRGTDILLHYNT